jgi:glycosyltransferase involved in cell wall biosynthesis
MSAGKAIVASDCGGVPEILRHEVDGLLARTGDSDSFRRALDRLLKSEALRLRLGRAARQRVEARFTDEIVARRSLAFYEWALGTAAPSPAARPVDRRRAIGPDDWFQVWWLRQDAAGEAPVLRPPGEGRAAFADCSLAEIAFAHRVLTRSYWAGPGRAETAEARFLDELATAHLDRARDARQRGAEPERGARLTLPACTHPLFASKVGAESFLAELWRLGESPEVADWLARETDSTLFVEAAKIRLPLRRLAVHAARIAPGPQSFEVLRRIYRSIGDAPRIVEQDREFIAADGAGAEFGRAVAELGLHAPMRRPAVFGRRRRRTAKAGAAAAEVTVLIPSYRHGPYVADAIRSALEQSLQPVRVLVVDDRSPDDTVAAARSVGDPRVEVRVNDQNLGLGRSIDRALDAVETPFVALLNSDDLFHPDRLERCIAALRDAPEARLVATGLATMDAAGQLLDAANVCVVEAGPQVGGWLRWYAGVREQLRRPEDWSALAPLLRHNHLATSSNIVCHTDFLRAQRGAVEGLRYCLDWMLFLRAAAAGQLVYVDEPLLGYRLHASNTVWFDDETRADYVHEVNHVQAVVLRDLASARRAAGVSEPQLFDELAALLRDEVARHGETDGFELFLAELIGRRPPDPEDAAAEPPPSTLLARDALARKARDRSLAGLSVPPWQLAELERRREPAQIAEHLAESLAGIEPRLRRRVAQLEDRAERRAERDADAEAMRAEFDAQREAWSDQRAAWDAERDAWDAERGAWDAERHAWEGQRAGLEQRIRSADAERVQLEGERARLERELAQLADRLAAKLAALASGQAELRDAQSRAAADLREAGRAAERRTAELQAEHARAVQAVRDRLGATERRLAEARSAAQQVRRELAAARAERDRRARLQQLGHGALLDLFAEYEAAVRQLTGSAAWGLGRALTAGLRLAGPFKTLRRATIRLQTAGGRAAARLGHRLGGGRGPVLAVLGDGPAARLAADGRALDLAALCANAGARTHLLSWHRGDPTGADFGPARPSRGRLRADAALFAADLRRAERAHGPALARLRAELGEERDLGPACSAAATLLALGASHVLAVGRGEAMLQALVHSELNGRALLIAVESRDLQPGRVDAAVLRAAVARAEQVLVDGPETGARLQDLCGRDAAAVEVLTPVPARSGSGPRGRTGPRLGLVCCGPRLDPARALDLIEALDRAVHGGVDLELVVLAPPDADAPDWEGLAGLARAAAAAPGLRGRLTVVRRPDGAARRQQLERADVLLEFDPGSSPPSARGAALAAGLPVVRLGDAPATDWAASLVALARDPERLAVLGRGARDEAERLAAAAAATLARLLGTQDGR